jgi:hypothetical protein
MLPSRVHEREGDANLLLDGHDSPTYSPTWATTWATAWATTWAKGRHPCRPSLSCSAVQHRDRLLRCRFDPLVTDVEVALDFPERSPGDQ